MLPLNEQIKIGTSLVRWLMLREMEMGLGKGEAERKVAELLNRLPSLVHKVANNHGHLHLEDFERDRLMRVIPELDRKLLRRLESGAERPLGWTVRVWGGPKLKHCRRCDMDVPEGLARNGVCEDCRSIDGDVALPPVAPTQRQLVRQRRCLRCDVSFLSEWAGNRLCQACNWSVQVTKPRTGGGGEAYELG